MPPKKTKQAKPRRNQSVVTLDSAFIVPETVSPFDEAMRKLVRVTKAELNGEIRKDQRRKAGRKT